MKIVNKGKILMRLVAADKLRARGFEVYSFPVSSVRHLPDLVAYRNERFYNIYLYESAEERVTELSSEILSAAFEYAQPLNAAVVSMIIRLVPREKHQKYKGQ